MNINEIYTSNSTFLKAADIKGANPVVTIENITVSTGKDQQSGDEYKQLVLHFVGKDKVLGLNKTNASKIAELVGSDDTDNWIGKTIKLHVENVQVGNERKDGIRIWPELPEQVTPPANNAPQHTGVSQSDADSGRW